MASRGPKSPVSKKQPSRGRKKHSSLKNYLVPHEGNEYHPKLFRTAAIGALILGIVLFEGAYILDTKLAQNHTGFLASVLPAALLDLTNADREASGVAPLIYDSNLAQAAQLKANDMAEKGYFAHTSPEGKSPWHWLEQVGYSYTYAGENLAVNFDDSSAVEEAWMSSPTHHANIVKPQYTRVGYAVAQGMYKGKETTFVVQEFATKAADQTVTTEVKPKNPVTKAVDSVIASISAPAEPKEAPAPEAQAPRLAVNARENEASRATEPAPTETPTEVTSEPVENGSTTPSVLGTNVDEVITNDSAIASFFVHIAASPLRSSIYVLGGLITLMAVLLIIALLSHAKVRYLEVLGGGLIVIFFALSVLVYNAMHAPTPLVPDTISESV